MSTSRACDAAGRAETDTMLSHEKLLSLVADNYVAIAPDLIGPLLNLLSLSREACGGDMDKFLIMVVVAIRTTAHKDFANYTQEQLHSGEMPVFPSLGINIQSIADSVGAPKETVRRKVVELVEAGWIERRGKDLFYTARAWQGLSAVGKQLEVTAVSYYETVAALADRAVKAPAPAKR